MYDAADQADCWSNTESIVDAAAQKLKRVDSASGGGGGGMAGPAIASVVDRSGFGR